MRSFRAIAYRLEKAGFSPAFVVFNSVYAGSAQRWATVDHVNFPLVNPNGLPMYIARAAWIGSN